MYGILMSALFNSITWIFKSVIVKFVIFFAIYFVATEFIQWLVSSSILPTSTTGQIRSYLASLPSMMLYMFSYFKIPTILTLTLSAIATRFAIRRIPMIG